MQVNVSMCERESVCVCVRERESVCVCERECVYDGRERKIRVVVPLKLTARKSREMIEVSKSPISNGRLNPTGVFWCMIPSKFSTEKLL